MLRFSADWSVTPGSEAGKQPDYLVQELEAAGIEYERHYYELMRSLPVQASVIVKKSESLI